MTVFQKFGIVCAGVLVSVVVSAQAWISTPDGVAGQALPVRVSGVAADEILNAELTRPDGSIVRWQQLADETGVAAASINSMHVRQAGEYQLAVVRTSGEKMATDFEIFPGTVSAFRSTVTAEKFSLAADGEQVSRVLISARDAWDNPIAGVPVQVVSSRNSDAVVVAPVTDAFGQVVAQVRSGTAGVSTLSVFADGVVFFSKPELVFFLAGNREILAVGSDGGFGKFLKTQIFDDEPVGLPAAYFTLEQLNSVTMAGENLTVRVVARDQNGEVTKDFAGTVRFSSSDDRATLPNDYVFTPADQGVHTYYLAVKLGTPGKQTVAVHDLNDFRISGEFSVDVKSGMAPIDIPAPAASVAITFPVDGGASSASRITIFGTTTDCAVVTLTDGITELVTGLAVDSENNFVYQTPRLADGYHEFLATCDEDASVSSSKVRLKVDTSAPQVAEVMLEPSGVVQPGQEVRVTVTGTESLAAVQIILDEFPTDLMSGEDKTIFSGAVVVPNAAGQYPISVVVVDELGNRFETPTGGVVDVGDKMPDDGGGAEAEVVPRQVMNLQATNGEIKKSTLTWDAPTDAEGLLKYQINFGLQGQQLLGQNVTPDTRTSWYVDGLEPGVTYDFQVTPIYSTEGLGVVSNVAPGTPAEPAGVAPTAVSNLQATSGEVEQVPLLWSPAMDDVGITQYKINYAVAGEDLVTGTITPDDRTQFVVQGLEACVTYQFRVTAVDTDGLFGVVSGVVEATPFCPDEMHESAPATPKSGAANLLIPFFAILAGVGAVMLLRKRTM